VYKTVIDPGHGGIDPGAIGPSGTKEKDINLIIARKVANLLSPIMETRLTRTEDKAVGSDANSDLKARADIANSWNADCFVSIHCNSAASPEAKGIETYHYPGSENGRRLALAIHRKIVPASGITDRGVKQANFAVLRLTNCPAVLVELAFISNPHEEILLKTTDFQERAAWAIAAGIAEFLGVQLQPAQPSPEDWKKKIIEDAKKAGLISQDHNPDEPAPKWFVLAIAQKNFRKVIKMLKQKTHISEILGGRGYSVVHSFIRGFRLRRG
jgi:N-acetylmuramoyl-L-alanine amidase